MASLTVSFKANTAGFQKGLNAVKAGIGGLAVVAGTVLAPLAGIAAAVGGLGAAFKGVSLAADMETATVSFETLLGSAEDAKTVLGEINTLAAKTPFGLTELVGAARSLMSITGKENVTSTLKMIGDLSSASGKDLQELASLYAKAVGSDQIMGEDLNQISDALGGQALKEFARVLGVDTIKAVRKLGSEGKISGAVLTQVFTNLTSKGGMAFNAMDAQSRTFNGLVSTLKDNFDGLLRTFGEPVMLALKPALTDGITLLESMQAKARAFGEAVAKAIVFLRNAFKGGELVSLSASGFILAAQSFVNVVVRGMVAAGGVIFNAFEAAGELIFGIFGNSAMWDSVRAVFDGVGLTIQKAILEAIPSNWMKDKEGSLAHVNELIGIRGNAADNYGSKAGRINAALFAAAGDKLKESGKVFGEVFKDAPNLFDTSGRMDALRKRWDALSKPSEADGPLYGPELPAKAAAPAKAPILPLVAFKANFEPIVSSLARIGGAAAVTNNPLVSLHQKTNDLLTKVVENTRPRPAGAAPSVYV